MTYGALKFTPTTHRSRNSLGSTMKPITSYLKLSSKARRNASSTKNKINDWINEANARANTQFCSPGKKVEYIPGPQPDHIRDAYMALGQHDNVNHIIPAELQQAYGTTDAVIGNGPQPLRTLSHPLLDPRLVIHDVTGMNYSNEPQHAEESDCSDDTASESSCTFEKEDSPPQQREYTRWEKSEALTDAKLLREDIHYYKKLLLGSYEPRFTIRGTEHEQKYRDKIAKMEAELEVAQAKVREVCGTMGERIMHEKRVKQQLQRLAEATPQQVAQWRREREAAEAQARKIKEEKARRRQEKKRLAEERKRAKEQQEKETEERYQVILAMWNQHVRDLQAQQLARVRQAQAEVPQIEEHDDLLRSQNVKRVILMGPN